MPKFLYVYHGLTLPETEDERARLMKTWGAWFQTMGSAVVDRGNPCGEARIVSASSVSEGGGVNATYGYSLVTAENLDKAVELTAGCPVFADGGTIEVAEALDTRP